MNYNFISNDYLLDDFIKVFIIIIELNLTLCCYYIAIIALYLVIHFYSAIISGAAINGDSATD